MFKKEEGTHRLSGLNIPRDLPVARQLPPITLQTKNNSIDLPRLARDGHTQTHTQAGRQAGRQAGPAGSQCFEKRIAHHAAPPAVQGGGNFSLRRHLVGAYPCTAQTAAQKNTHARTRTHTHKPKKRTTGRDRCDRGS
jgi:hypothetical protein